MFFLHYTLVYLGSTIIILFVVVGSAMSCFFQMIARSEDEFEKFQQMDIERRRQEAALGAERKPRLIEESELPPFLLQVIAKAFFGTLPYCVLIQQKKQKDNQIELQF